MKTSNKKYEITDIVHETYPFLHRVRALRDIGENVNDFLVMPVKPRYNKMRPCEGGNG